MTFIMFFLGNRIFPMSVIIRKCFLLTNLCGYLKNDIINDCND